MNEWMNEWTDLWMKYGFNALVNESDIKRINYSRRMNEWLNKSAYALQNPSLNQWMNLGVWLSESTIEGMNECLSEFLSERIQKWVNGGWT